MANIGSYPLNEIITGDSRLFAPSLPDGCIDLIFTDPVYPNKEDYLWLASVALRTLKPTGVLLCWSNGKWHRENANWLESAGLKYRYDFDEWKTDYYKLTVAEFGEVITNSND